MAITEGQFKAFIESTRQAATLIREKAEKSGFIHVVSHLDADGIAAAGIIGKALLRLEANFRIRIQQWMDEKIVGELVSDKPDLAILSDMGSGYLELLCAGLKGFDAIILDHHQPIGENSCPTLLQVNPHLQGIDASRDISGAGVCYYVAKALDSSNADSAPIAVVGALGDLQDKYEQKSLGGLNRTIVEDAVKAGVMKEEKDLIFFGRETRQIQKALANTTSPFIPGISGEEDKSLAFLASLGIKPKDGDRWRALRDLSEEEKTKLCSALVDYLVANGYSSSALNLIGNVYILLREEPWTPLRDGREFSVLLNATGRLDRPSLGVALCMGDRTSALDQANQTLDEYRRTITKYLGWVMEKPGRIEELDNVYLVRGDGFIDEKVVSTISSILSTSLPKPEKPLLAYAKVPDEDAVKFSARTLDMMTAKGLDLGEIMRRAAEKFEGRGGGHNIAAGAQVPIENVDAFVACVNELVKQQLGGKDKTSL
jgi:single-stranded-DNA-specific exonuclease